MLVRHSKEVLVEVLKTGLRYHIPLYLPTEKLAFRTSELILDVPLKVDSYIDLKKLEEVAKEKPKKIELPLQ